MSKEPAVRFSIASSSPPYARQGAELPSLTLNNFHTFSTRVKKLPPDANVSAAAHTNLYQFKERVSFGCAQCRRDKIMSDSVAVNLHQRSILCTACFTRLIRPRTYRPNRVVPFPSLLSWLDYQPLKATEVPTDILSRAAEAVVPSGDRMAAPQAHLVGEAASRLHSLPAIAMKVSSTSVSADQQPSSVDQERHPCVRTWGSCLHGAICHFRNAPSDLCLAYLMGLCTGDDSCHLLHQPIYNLPSQVPHPEAPRGAGDLEDETSPWHRWVAERMKSTNKAEWQLWHNGPLGSIFEEFAPAVLSEDANEEGDGEVALDVLDILSALQSIPG